MWRDPSTQVLRTFAKRMRSEPTEAERKLWLILRARRFSGFKFRRQVPLGPYIADFVCFERRLIVEADGSQHGESLRDGVRDAWLAAQGFRVRRFWNTDILARAQEVADTLWEDLAGGPLIRPSGTFSRKGRRQLNAMIQSDPVSPCGRRWREAPDEGTRYPVRPPIRVGMSSGRKP